MHPGTYQDGYARVDTDRVATGLAALGHTVIIAARSAEQGEKAPSKLRGTGADAISVVLDVTDPESVRGAMLPLLRRSSAPRIVNVSSSAGSLAGLADLDNEYPPSVGYVPSKTALTALTLLYACDLRDDGILVNATNPGLVAIDLNNNMGASDAEGTCGCRRAHGHIPADGPTGTCTDDQGSAVPW